jgi:hypothetical protein
MQELVLSRRTYDGFGNDPGANPPDDARLLSIEPGETDFFARHPGSKDAVQRVGRAKVSRICTVCGGLERFRNEPSELDLPGRLVRWLPARHISSAIKDSSMTMAMQKDGKRDRPLARCNAHAAR